ncbi:MAG: hypothetical protein MI810_17605, partial [Flavobacteriales bacterium]|nr:hypothetical protein [Flavobacteriales bacterium]
PYQFDGNMPTRFIELEGLEPGVDGTRPGEQAWATSAHGDENTYYNYTWTEFMSGAFRWETDGAKKSYDEVLNDKLGIWNGREGSHISDGGSNLIKLDPLNNTYGIIQPRSYGEWGQAGSDGRIWIGCLSCHSPIGAYTQSVDLLGWHKAAFASSLAWGLVGPKMPPLLRSSRVLVQTSGNSLEVLPMRIVNPIHKGAKIADLIDNAKRLTYITGNEHALVGFNNGTRALVSGGAGGIRFDSNVKIIFGHTHPAVRGGAAFNQPSIWDYNSIFMLNQSKQRVLIPGGGMKTIFNQGVKINDLNNLLIQPVTNYSF